MPNIDYLRWVNPSEDDPNAGYTITFADSSECGTDAQSTSNRSTAEDLASLSLPRCRRSRPAPVRADVEVAYINEDYFDSKARFFVHVPARCEMLDVVPIEPIPEELIQLALRLRKEWGDAVKEWTDHKYESMPL